MKHIQLFEEFIYDNYYNIHEKVTFSSASIKKAGLSDYKKEFNKIKNFSIKLGKYTFKLKKVEYDKYQKESDLLKNFKNALNGDTVSWNPYNGDRFNFEVNDKIVSVGIKNKFSVSSRDSSFNIGINPVDFSYHIQKRGIEKGFLKLFEEEFKKNKKEIIKHLDFYFNLKTLYVIPAGKISPKTGKTGHGWSIYDNPDSNLGKSEVGHDLLWFSNGNIKVGDSFRILHDQTHKVIHNKFTINEIIKPDYDSFVSFSKRTGAKIPIKSFTKQSGSFNYRLLSVK